MGRTELHLSQILNTEQYVLNESEQSTVSTTFVPAASISVSSPGTTYAIFLSAEGLASTTQTQLEVQLLVNSDIVASSFIVPIKDNNYWYPYSTMYITGLVPGTHEISFQFRAANGTSVSVRRVRIFIMDLS